MVDSIYAAQLEIDEKTGLVVGYKPNTIILPRQKGLASAHFAKSMTVQEKNVLAIGDSLVDSLLGSSKENRFGIAEDENQLKRIRNVMGECAITQDFSPAISWLLNKLNKTPA
ncbi:MAG: cytochrome P450 [Patescibacteria group bacterium]|nr:cytochrome P450 [Patescibacteria group bacterium]